MGSDTMNQPLYGARHEGPFTPMFEGKKIHLVVGGLTLEVLDHAIIRPEKTWVKEAGDEEAREIPNSLAGVIYGEGNVEFSRTKAFIELDADEQASIPHGVFEALTPEERAEHGSAEWKFSFDYTRPPVSEPM
jgi:hypothetical protein